jgi:large repetitive protein
MKSLAVAILLAAILPGLLAAVAQPPVTDGLLLYLPFAGEIRDQSPADRPLVVVGTPALTTAATGCPSNALAFDGSGDFLIVSDEAPFDLSAFTLAAVVRAPSRAARQVVLAKPSLTGFGNFTVDIVDSDHPTLPNWLYFTIDTSLGNWTIPVGGPLPDDQHVHFAVTLDPSDGYRAYLDGQPTFTAANPPVPVMNDQRLTIGYASSLAWPAFQGVLDEIYVFDRALSATEVANLHLAAMQPVDPATCWPIFADGFESGDTDAW